jgi:hypothetical protein
MGASMIEETKKRTEGAPRAGSQSRPAFRSDDELAAAFRRFQRRFLDDGPLDPDVLKIIRTPLGFQPD